MENESQVVMHRIVLYWAAASKDNVHFLEATEYADDPERVVLVLRKRVWEDLGSPGIITVSVESGNRITGDSF